MQEDITRDLAEVCERSSASWPSDILIQAGWQLEMSIRTHARDHLFECLFTGVDGFSVELVVKDGHGENFALYHAGQQASSYVRRGAIK